MKTPYQIIDAKKHGNRLTDEDIRYFIGGYMSNDISDAQMSALLMAICFNGMDASECTSLTLAMAESGEQLDMSSFPSLMDKHSTGGVGDKTTFLVGPMVAALGYPVGMMSGRGLGHTGGTIDKLESIPGFTAALSADAYRETISQCGFSIISQTPELAPADARMYALRDLTATVDSLPLIAASIMSKKIASGTRNIVLDVKYGSGAFLPDKADSMRLAKMMEDIAAGCGIKAKAVLSDAGDILGNHAGNATEIAECLDILSGNIPAGCEELVELSVKLATELILLESPDSCPLGVGRRLYQTLEDGSALEKFGAMCECQGAEMDGSVPIVKHLPDKQVPVFAGKCGQVAEVDAKGIGLSIVRMGGGRAFPGDAVCADVGVEALVHRGDMVSEGDAIAYIEYLEEESSSRLEAVLPGEAEALSRCWTID